MAPLDRRVRVAGWVVRRVINDRRLTEAGLTARQAWGVPRNPLTDWQLGTVAPRIEVTGRTIPGPGGKIPLRIYCPGRASPAPRPVIIHIHGGGFVFGSPRLGDWLCSRVARTVGAVVVSVDYRLAPGHRFPAAVDDAYAAVLWAAENRAHLGADGPMAVMGESAGGNLAAVMCLLARDRGGPVISHQALLYPATDLTKVPAAGRAMPFLSHAEMRAYRAHYLGDADPSDFRASPLLADDHGKLPPALLQVAEHDPLRRDGTRYAAALRAAGVPVRLTEYVGMPHGFLNLPGLCRCAPQALAELCAEQAAALALPGGVSRVQEPL